MAKSKAQHRAMMRSVRLKGYVRYKIINDTPYLYKVRGIWKDGQTKQKVVKYLGKATPNQIKKYGVEIPQKYL